MTTTGAESAPAEQSIPQNESKAQQQARLRRERRNAKIQADGTERLNKISTMSGRPAAAEADLHKARSNSPRPPSPHAKQNNATVEDPDEVDISSVSQNSGTHSQSQSQEDMMRQLLRGPATAAEGKAGASGPEGVAQDSPEDPMMRMMQQLMGSMGEQSGTQQPDPQMQAFAELFGAASSKHEPGLNNHDRIWRVIHALCAFALAFYALSSYQLVGSKLERSQVPRDQPSRPLFWLFTTTQLVLQSSRYFLEGGRPPPSGLLATAGRMVPEPYGNYLRILSRYRIIYNTIINDALIVIFVLGFASWWNGLAGS